LSDARTPLSHVHGNITNDGKVGSTSGLPVVTTTAGAVTTLALGTANQVLRVNSGATGVEFGAGFDAASPPAIGNTTPSTGAFTTLSAAPTSGSALTLTGGTITASAPLISATQTWNNAAVTFTGLLVNATNTASATASLLADFQVGGTSAARIRRDGAMTANSYFFNGGPTAGFQYLDPFFYASFGSTVSFIFRGSGSNISGIPFQLGSTNGAMFHNDADAVAGQRNGTIAQTFRIYNTFTSTTNFERLNIIAQSAASVIIGTEKGSAGGTARALEFQTDGVTRLTIGTAGASMALAVGIAVAFSERARIIPSGGDGVLRLTNIADTGFGLLQFGGTTSAFPALKRSSTTLQVRIADDSGFAPLAAGSITATGNLVVTDNTGSETATFDAQAKLTANRTYDLPDASGTIAINPMTTAGDIVVGGTSGAPARLALGTASQQLRVNSGATALEYFTPAAGGTKTYALFRAYNDSMPPSTAFATLDSRNNIGVADFDDATDESLFFMGIIPEAASLGSGLKIRLQWMATTATSGDVVWDVSLERMTTDLDSDSFDTIASGTAAANGTSGILTVTEITLTTIDSVTAGDGYRLKVTRDANNASDTMTGDAELVAVEVRSAA
jgi:hypothetical protein